MDKGLPDIVRDFKLVTRVDRLHTSHLVDDPNAPPSSPKQWQSWRTDASLGQGGQGEVRLQKCVSGGLGNSHRAVKMIRLQDNRTRRRIVQELETLARFSHAKYEKYFVKMLGWYELPGSICIAMGHFPAGDLWNYINTHPALPEDEARQITGQILSGLSLMHTEKFAHGDIKPQNILIQRYPQPNSSETWWVKLADFGISKSLDMATNSTTYGTQLFMSPELFDRSIPSDLNYQAADMWALGVTTYCILTTTPPFPDVTSILRYRDNSESLYPSGALNTYQVSPEGQAFIRSLMRPQHQHRSDTAAAMLDTWIAPYIPKNPEIPDMFNRRMDSDPDMNESMDEGVVFLESAQLTTGYFSREWSPPMSEGPKSESNLPTAARTAGSRRRATEPLNLISQVQSETRTGRRSQAPEMGLKEAVRNGRVRILAQHLKQGADATFRDEDGWSLVGIAAVSGQVETLRFLLDHGFDADVSNDDGLTPAQAAIREGHEGVVSLLLSRGADVRAKYRNHHNLLFMAIFYHRVGVVRLIVEKGADLDETDPQGCTPLILATCRGSEAMVRLLVGKGAKIDGKGSYVPEQIPRGEAALRRYSTPLWWSLFNQQEGVARVLIESGANLEEKDIGDMAPLMHAVVYQCEAMARLFVDSGANLETKDSLGTSPLLMASCRGYEPMAKLLVDKGANIEAKGMKGDTPLLGAILNGHEPVARLLVEKGANLDTKNAEGTLPLQSAILYGQEPLVRLLVDKGVNLEAKDIEGRPPLLLAIERGHEEIVRLLVEKGANIDARNAQNKTTVQIALDYGLRDLARFLAERGAKVDLRDRLLYFFRHGRSHGQDHTAQMET